MTLFPLTKFHTGGWFKMTDFLITSKNQVHGLCDDRFFEDLKKYQSLKTMKYVAVNPPTQVCGGGTFCRCFTEPCGLRRPRGSYMRRKPRKPVDRVTLYIVHVWGHQRSRFPLRYRGYSDKPDPQVCQTRGYSAAVQKVFFKINIIFTINFCLFMLNPRT